jgi:hypothetical protein
VYRFRRPDEEKDQPMTVRKFLWSVVLVAPCAGWAQSHCTPQEDVVFSCTLQSRKVISVCASKQLLEQPAKGYLSYRAGVLGAVELEYPAVRDASSADKFVFGHYFRYQTDRSWLTFSNGEYTYTVYDNYDGDARPKMSSGVGVSHSGSQTSGSQKSTTLLCVGKAKAQWSLIDGAVPCSDEGLSTCNPRTSK